MNNNKTEKHILSLSGGKDSAALAVYMRQKYPDLDLQYVFIDSGCELPETYQYLDKIRAVLNIEITQIGGANKQDRKDFAWWLKQKENYLPSPKNRWCTEILKLKPYDEWLGINCSDMVVHSYVGLRADEKRERKGFVNPQKAEIIQHHPFIEDGLVYADIEALLLTSGLGFPDYYKWRTRSGCYFCFYQTQREWIGLLDNHPELFEKAAAMEKFNLKTGKKYTWSERSSLKELAKSRDEILAANQDTSSSVNKQTKLIDSLACIECPLLDNLF